CDATQAFPLAQLATLETVIKGDMDALREQIGELDRKRELQMLADAAAKFALAQAAVVVEKKPDPPPPPVVVVEKKPHPPAPPVIVVEKKPDPPPPPVIVVEKKPDPRGVAKEGEVEAPKEERVRVADKQGPLTHRGAPVEFGAEKET